MMKPLNEIALGLFIAALGTGATALYILALSHLFIGQWKPMLLEAFLSVCLLIIFRRAINAYLDRVMRRFTTNSEKQTKTPDE